MYSRLLDCLKHNNIIVTRQHSFRVDSLINDNMQSLDRGKCTIGVVYDLSRGFHCVDHSTFGGDAGALRS